MSCEAYQQNDQMYCSQCSLIWDIGDTDPPKCGERLLTRVEIRERLRALSERMAVGPCGTCDISGPEWCELGRERGAPCNPIN